MGKEREGREQEKETGEREKRENTQRDRLVYTCTLSNRCTAKASLLSERKKVKRDFNVI